MFGSGFGDASDYDKMVTASVYTPGDLVYVAVTWDTTAVRGYVNGVLVTTSTHAPQLVFPSNMGIGCSTDGQYPLNGLIDDLRISSRARSADEIYRDWANLLLFKPMALERDSIKLVCGVEVDDLNLTFYPTAEDLVGGVPFATAAYRGILDNATLLLERAFFK
jgi:hypothetical protein